MSEMILQEARGWSPPPSTQQTLENIYLSRKKIENIFVPHFLQLPSSTINFSLRPQTESPSHCPFIKALSQIRYCWKIFGIVTK